MQFFIGHQNRNHIIFTLFKTIVLGILFTNSIVNAASVNLSIDEKTILLHEQDYGSEVDNIITTIDDFFDFDKLFESVSKKSRQLAKEGVEEIRRGNKKTGILFLQEAWKMNPNVIETGTVLTLYLIQDSKFEQALSIAKQIQQSAGIENYGMGYTLEGLVYSAQDRSERASISFKEALKLIPNEKNALINLANIAIHKNNIKDAKNYLQTILNVDPLHLKSLEKLAKIEFNQGNTKKATSLLSKAIDAHPKAIRPLLTLTQNHIKLAHYQKAIDLTNKSQNPIILELRANAYLASGNPKKAQLVIEKIIELLPKSATANFLLANFFAKTGDFKESAKQIQSTIKKDPKFLLARIAEIKTLFYTNKKPEAEKASKKLIEEFGNNADVLSIAGWLALHQKQYAQAASYFELVAESNQSPEITLWWSASLWKQNHKEKSISILEQGEKNHSDNILILLALADGYMGNQQNVKAKKTYLKLLTLQPKIASVYNNLAWIEQEKNLKKSIAYAKEGLALEENNPQILDTLGLLLIKDGKTLQGASLLDKASKIAPKNLNIRYHIAEAAILQKDYTKASLILKNLSSIDLVNPMKNRVKTLLKNIPAN